MPELLTLILAAGKGTRMKSDLVKVLHRVSGKIMVQHVIDAVYSLDSDIILITGYQSQRVREYIADERIMFLEQKEQLGTGHAVLQAKEYINKHNGLVLILYGDTPLLTEKTLKKLIAFHKESHAEASVLTAILSEPYGYGRIIRDGKKQIEKIVEEKDANEEEKQINEINSGVYCFNSMILRKSLDNINNNNAQGEFYLTDAVSYIRSIGGMIKPVEVDNPDEIIGVNDRKNLAKVEKILRKRILDLHMESGVTIIDPDATYIDSEVIIGNDTIVYPSTYIEGKSKIGSHSIIGPNCRLLDVELGDNVNLRSNCIVYESMIKDNAVIGPFAYIRPGCKIDKNVKVGDFVELKKSTIGQESKVPHLSYIGDAEIGKGTNIGAGTIFANYDGKKKNKCKVGDSVFIGSNTTLVAPVKIGNKAVTGAGSVVTKDVEKNSTVVGVPARIFKKKDGK
jgi:bifunctional UDP-N-acetylglucosamine pyrophosphorylase / glucosamine-1-phosphate N-acetyltransferase